MKLKNNPVHKLKTTYSTFQTATSMPLINSPQVQWNQPLGLSTKWTSLSKEPT